MLGKKMLLPPLGYSEVFYRKKRYGIIRVDFNKGKSLKLYARELGGNDFISLNYYMTKKAAILKPCEMSKEKVCHFLNNYKLIEPWKIRLH